MTLTTFTPDPGVFVNGTSPLSAAVMNAFRTFCLAGWFDSAITSDGSGGLQSLNLKPTTAVSINGTTAGTAIVYEVLQGTLKAFLLFYNGYRNSTATEQRITLPTPFTTRAIVITGGVPATSVWNAGALVASQFEIVTTLPAGTGAGGTTSNSRVNGFSYGDITSAFDQVGCGVSQGSNTTAIAFFVGV